MLGDLLSVLVLNLRNIAPIRTAKRITKFEREETKLNKENINVFNSLKLDNVNENSKSYYLKTYPSIENLYKYFHGTLLQLISRNFKILI